VTAVPLLLILAATGVLYGVIALNKWALDPKLGLDLQGGSSVILTPKVIGGGDVTPASLNKAVEIISLRVNAFGVSEAEVTREGQNIVVSIPGGNREQLAQVDKPAQLRFRLVYADAAGTTAEEPEPTATPTESPKPTGTAPPTPSPTATANGRALTSALRAQTPTGSPTASPTGSPAPTDSPAPAAGDQGLADAQALFVRLDCAENASEAKKAEAQKAADADANADIYVALCSDDGTSKYLLGPALMTGNDVRSAKAETGVNPQGVSTGQWLVNLTLTGDGRKKFSTVTRENNQQSDPGCLTPADPTKPRCQFAIVLDGRVVSPPSINEPITGGEAQISGDFTKKTASELANVLKFGALPLSFTRSQEETISPTLGKESLRAGLIAGLAGMAAVLIYMIVYYRGLGLVTVGGLALWSALNFALVIILGNTIGFTLTLAGIAGFIISAGITSDSYIVYFERLKDEAREGRTIQSSADRGFGRAFKTILAADVVSFLAALILYIFSVGAVRGFAFTLGMSTLLDVVIAFLFTRPVVAMLSRTKLFTQGRFVGIKGSVPIAERSGRRQPKEA
jgi:preprotein translocase subunit SecD